MPHLRAKPAAALVGLPSASKAIWALGPRMTSSMASVATATSETMAARRLGEETTRTAPWESPATSSLFWTSLGSCFAAFMSGAEGISSQPISSRKSRVSAI